MPVPLWVSNSYLLNVEEDDFDSAECLLLGEG